MTWFTKCDICNSRNVCDLPMLWDEEGCGLFEAITDKLKVAIWEEKYAMGKERRK